MSLNNKYQIFYLKYQNGFSIWYKWRIIIPKLKLSLYFGNNTEHKIQSHKNTSYGQSNIILNNFLIEPNLINMLNSKDKFQINIAFEILNQRINERTG